MPVIGTAGHVDHGKSTLVQALTGRDPDRWREEKERGLTIDLGFAWTALPGGVEVSFVDVPGHERFIKNMLAGIEAIDVALLVVAADEGWMPQTEEHAAVLDLLGVTRAVVAVTMIDRVEADLVELALLEVEEQIRGTSLDGSQIIAVSSVEKTGLDELRSALERLIAADTTSDSGRPRMWIDRSFTIAGAGTVVTGTLVDGAISVGDEVAVWPGPTRARVRGIQSHERQIEKALPSNRVALNLSGDRSQYERGSMLGLPGHWRTTHRAALGIRPARYVEELTNRGAYHLHTGSGAWPVTLRLIDPESAVVELPEPLCLKVGDKFILRETGRRLVVGGGVVLDPHPPRRLRNLRLAELRSTDSPDGWAGVLLATRGSDTLAGLAADTGGGRPAAGVTVGEVTFDAARVSDIGRDLEERVARFHEENPLRPGLPLAQAASSLGVSVEAVAAFAGKHLRIDGAIVAAVDHEAKTTEEQRTAWTAAQAALEQAGVLAVPRAQELGLDPEHMHALVRAGELVRVSADFVYLPDQVEELLALLRDIEDGFTVSEFKDRAGLSRKYAVPFLEWADANGHTVRSGDVRRVRR